MIKLLQVSDIHLGNPEVGGLAERKARSTRHWQRFLETADFAGVTAVILSGDLLVDDPDDPADQRWTKYCLAQLPCPAWVIPGNHDVGDHPIRTGLPAGWQGKQVARAG